MDNPTATENMHKLIYLANEYPGHKVEKLYNMFQMTDLDFNAAMWLAQDLGFLAEKNNKFDVVALPQKWDLGIRIDSMMKTIVFVFNHLADKETDLTEHELNTWMQGYPTHDQFIAVKYLLNTGVLASYDITTKTGKGLKNETYTFYCLAENVNKKYGRKQFKDQSRIVNE